jgi:EmrB/QacA subfamily drug resistance transporter
VNDDGRLTPEIKAVAIVVVVGAIMSILDTTIVNVALETLSRDLDADLSTIQWVSTAYLLALATVIPLTGWAAERFGPKRVWMTVVSGFVVSSALCGLAWSAERLIAFRVLQGLAGGMVMPIGMITLAQTAGPQRMGRVMSVVGVPMLLAPVLGPVIGGLIVENLSWRWIFYVNLPIGLVGLALAAKLLPSGRAQGLDATTKLDWRGLVLLSPGVAMLVFGLSEVGSQGSVSGVDLAWMVAGLTLIATFVVRALRIERPLVDVRLFRGHGFSAAAATTFIVGMALFGSMLLLPLYFQVARGESPLHAGLLVAPQGLGAAFAMRFSGRMADRVGGGRVVLIGLTILTAATIPFGLIAAGTPYWLLALCVLARGVGLGFTMMPAMAAAYATLEHQQVPRATPMLNVVQRVGGSIGTAVLAVVLQRQLVGAIPGGGGGLGDVQSAPAGARERLAEPLATAFGHTYWWALALTAVAFVPATALAVTEGRERRARAAAGAADASRGRAPQAATIAG